MDGMPNPGYDADMLRRAAEACRNIQRTAVGNREWFDWVPTHLDQLADRIDPRDPDERGLPFVPAMQRLEAVTFAENIRRREQARSSSS